MAQNRGKKFEAQIQKGLTSQEKYLCWDRVKDNVGRYKGVRGICDFTTFIDGTYFYFECKSTLERTLPFTNFTEAQWEGLLMKSNYDGVLAGAFIWFVNYDLNIWVDIRTLEQLKNRGKKSLSILDLKDIPHIEMAATRKRTLYSYNMLETFLRIRRRFEENEGFCNLIQRD